jgi:hypothetical protein
VVKELLTAILKAVERVGAHKVTSQKQEVSVFLLYIPQKHFIDANFSFYYFLFVQQPWIQVMDMLFKRGAACEQYKWLQKIYDFKNKVLSAMK